MVYADYIASPEWRARKKKLWRGTNLHRYPFCRCCLRSTKKLELHHKTYVRLGREKMSDLIPVCRDCHGRIHEIAGSCEPTRLSLAFEELRAHYRENPVAYKVIRVEKPAAVGPLV